MDSEVPDIEGAKIQETQFSNNLDDDPSEPSESIVSQRNDLTTDNSRTRQLNYRYGTVSGTAGTLVHAEAPTSKAINLPRAVAPDLLRGLLMVLQAIDHSALILGAWNHGVAIESEADGAMVHEWNNPTAWTARMLTHLCAPGFTFLLGMGVVYFGRSRRKLGWSYGQLAKHFVVRALALALVNEIFLTLLLARGKLWILNIILLALAIDYFLAGMLWLGVNFSERCFARILSSFHHQRSNNSVDSQPLLTESSTQSETSSRIESNFAHNISWHFHNCLLCCLVVVSIGWNHWLSRDGGRCGDQSFSSAAQLSSSATINNFGTFFNFWFYPTATEKVQSPFPPLAWLSFAIMGVLYGRIVLARTWSPRTVNLGNMLAGFMLLLLFVATRLFHFGNLSEDCLQMPEQQMHPHRNQYLASIRSFLYIVKYPPSAAYFTLTMAGNFFLLATFGAIPARYATRIPGLMVFGTSALFFYILHLILYGALAIPIKAWFGHDLGYRDPMTGKPGVGVGNSAAFWLTFFLGLAILYPLCRWYGRFKGRKGADSIWRFF